ncbi:hypothetical protein [Proteiniclasticum ruminis]|uniref:hypothetical protein n=1 Tax=Proteiniclasticum ruminis TaxID=398199 RepID=UPI0028A73FED|nr:hypothetical protein [Proteiniclasticum ruminis]
MKVMFIVYHDLKTEARSQEILECAKSIGDTVLVSYSKPFNDIKCKCIETGKGKRKYFQFIIAALKAIVKERPEVVILHDNYTSVLIPYIRLFSKKTKVIYDSSELYIDKNRDKGLKSVKSEFLRLSEKKFINRADITIAANIERARIMKTYFNLKADPIVFDNIHKIEDIYDINTCQEKYGHLFKDDVFNIVYGGGISKKRLTLELTKTVGDLGNEFSLIILGNADKKDKEEFYTLLEDNNINNVTYIGFISRAELRYMLKNASISVSIFSQDTVNNINCASGKLFESLFEGTPVLTSENPPLKRVCIDYGVGISTNNFYDGIIKLRENYSYYCSNVNDYVRKIEFSNRVGNLSRALISELKL